MPHNWGGHPYFAYSLHLKAWSVRLVPPTATLGLLLVFINKRIASMNG